MTHLLAAALGAAAALSGMALVGWWLAAEVVDETDDVGDYGVLPSDGVATRIPQKLWGMDVVEDPAMSGETFWIGYPSTPTRN